MFSIMKAITLFLLPLLHAAPTLPFPPPAELTQGYVNTNISLIAGGSLPKVSTDAQYTTAGITALQLLASLENIEAFFYADAIQNLTSGINTRCHLQNRCSMFGPCTSQPLDFHPGS
jgi:hypothetical protein